MSTAPEPLVGASAALEFVVGEDDTAIALGSGELSVLATPRVVAWLEAACVGCLTLTETQASVGTRVEVEHVKASRVGARIEVTATIAYVDGRLVRFDVVAEDTGYDGQSRLDGAVTRIAHGTMTRVVVERERFLSRLV